VNVEEKHFYRFNSFLLDVEERQLLKDGVQIPLMPKAFDVLVALLERQGHVVEKHELLRLVWSDTFVEEGNITRIVYTLRKVLGEDENGSKFIETVAKKGYRFVAKVEAISENGVNPPSIDPLFDSGSRNLVRASTDNIEESFTLEGHPTEFRKKKIYQRSQSSVVLTLTIGLVLTAAFAGFWYSKNLWATKLVVKNIPSQTQNGEAYQHYQQGKLLLERKLKGDNKLALASFEKAIELDPNYAAAYVGKADAKIWRFWGSRAHDDITQARTAISKALELDDANSYGHTLLCRIKVTYDWDFDGGIKECRRAIELDPNSPDAHTEWANFLKVLGRDDEALAEIDTAIKLAPTSFNKRSRGVILYYARRDDEAIAQLQQVAETDPNFAIASKWIVRSYEMKNEYAHAFEWYLRQVEQDGANPEEIADLKENYNKTGWNGVLRRMIDTNKPEGRNKDFGFTETAIMYCQLGENDKAFESFNEAFERRELFLTHIKREPRLDSLRSDPRFEELVKRIGLK
jgi:DNA-binding winged helix-turn-helix (wHTH) protein/tetratricopeptide (TPR) repeat protein